MKLISYRRQEALHIGVLTPDGVVDSVRVVLQASVKGFRCVSIRD